MPALWKKCKRCRRLYRAGRTAAARSLVNGRCCFCPSNTRLHGIRKELAVPFEAAYLLGGIRAAQELATPGWKFDQLIDGNLVINDE